MKVLFCLPGNQFSEHYFHSWNNTIQVMSQNNIEWAYSMNYDPVVFYTRNKILGGNNNFGKNQRPFQGNLPYDWLVWIDSDMVWSGNDVMKLISHQNRDIVSGCYVTADNQHYPIVTDLDYNHLEEHGSFRFMNREELNARSEPFLANYVGFGFLAIKSGVIERMEYPWFRPRFIERDNFFDFSAEDVGFCWGAKDLGIDIWVDPTVRVAHQKSLLLAG